MRKGKRRFRNSKRSPPPCPGRRDERDSIAKASARACFSFLPACSCDIRTMCAAHRVHKSFRGTPSRGKQRSGVPLRKSTFLTSRLDVLVVGTGQPQASYFPSARAMRRARVATPSLLVLAIMTAPALLVLRTILASLGFVLVRPKATGVGPARPISTVARNALARSLRPPTLFLVDVQIGRAHV